MKKSNIIVFLIVILIIAGIFGFAFLEMRKNSGENQNANNISNTMEDIETNSIEEEKNNKNSNNVNENSTNENQNTAVEQNGSTSNGLTQNLRQYVGEWYINEEAYINSEKIDELMDRREDFLLTDQEFEDQLKELKNDEIAELDIEQYNGSRIKFDFELTGPAPTQRVANIDDIIVEITNGVGTFTYTDNWGTSGNGTITLKENQIELKLETTKVNFGTLWGVEGIYTFSYRK